MLQGMIARGATIFSRRMYSRLWSACAVTSSIIHQGRLVAQGSLEEHSHGRYEAQIPAPGGHRNSRRKHVKAFLRIVGGTGSSEQELSWLGKCSVCDAILSRTYNCVNVHNILVHNMFRKEHFVKSIRGPGTKGPQRQCFFSS